MNPINQKKRWGLYGLMEGKYRTLTELSEASRVSRATIRRLYLNNSYTPRLDTLIKLCDALERPLSELEDIFT